MRVFDAVIAIQMYKNHIVSWTEGTFILFIKEAAAPKPSGYAAVFRLTKLL
jgi:hypothetical protein